MKKNDIVDLDITGTLHDGCGVGRADGAAVFVPGTAEGDRVRALIIKVEKSFYRAKLLQVLTASQDRTEPSCGVYEKCGGCVYMHISYEAECRLKQQRVQDCISRIAGLDLKVKDIVPSPKTEHYRNKAQYPVAADRSGRITAGFYAPFSHRVVECGDCITQSREANAAKDVFIKYMNSCGVSAYDEKTGKGLVRHIFVRTGEKTGQVCVMPVINGEKLPKAQLLIKELKAALPGLSSVVLNINKKQGNVILGEKCVTLWGNDFIEDVLCGLTFKISPLSFYQINRGQCEQLYAKAKEYAALTGKETVIDLYCGIGTIGLTMAGKAKKIIGVEVVPEAVRDARINAQKNNIENAEFLCGTADTLAETLLKSGERPHVVIVDPPRKGCEKELIETITEMEPDRVVYVSCDPATLARDLKIFDELGYKTREVTPFDMFPRTGHVETVVLMSRV